MSLSPLLSAGPVIATHALVAIAAIALGALQLVLPKGTSYHRIAGLSWIAAMALVALSSFFIHEFRTFGPFSPIHILSAITLWALWSGIAAARRGDIARHRQTMRALFVLALVLTGGFTLVPGRRMHAVLFGG
ncbi:DUF2306 domain-containing protein [Roseovarius sp. D22-M7]|uniref:DUF2306 domain-containing protein n=1 Tax=Roseovarius sp. D22-M7 TaxID=3127116 RepID=UPI00300FAB66